jgi:hypothetical protein
MPKSIIPYDFVHLFTLKCLRVGPPGESTFLPTFVELFIHAPLSLVMSESNRIVMGPETRSCVLDRH